MLVSLILNNHRNEAISPIFEQVAGYQTEFTRTKYKLSINKLTQNQQLKNSGTAIGKTVFSQKAESKQIASLCNEYQLHVPIFQVSRKSSKKFQIQRVSKKYEISINTIGQAKNKSINMQNTIMLWLLLTYSCISSFMQIQRALKQNKSSTSS